MVSLVKDVFKKNSRIWEFSEHRNPGTSGYRNPPKGKGVGRPPFKKGKDDMWESPEGKWGDPEMKKGRVVLLSKFSH